MDTDGSNQTRLTDNTYSDAVPTWSPDSTKIAFHSNRDSANDIVVMNSDGSEQVNITQTAFNDGYASWSPDGNQIAFRSGRDGTGNDVFVMDSDGSNQQQITNLTAFNTVPDWSPDGAKITFYSTHTGKQEVYTINIDGSNAERITENDSRDLNPVWSPDGTKMAFQSDRDGVLWQIYAMSIDGTNQQGLTDATFSDGGPEWQPLTIPPSTIDSNRSFDVETGKSITFGTVTNHEDTYGEPDPGSVVITTDPEKGEATVDPGTGKVTYTANQDTTADNRGPLRNVLAILNPWPVVLAQSANEDSLSYEICSDQHEELCTTETVAFNIESTVPGLPDTGYGLNSNNYLSLLMTLTTAAGLSGVYCLRRTRKT